MATSLRTLLADLKPVSCPIVKGSSPKSIGSLESITPILRILGINDGTRERESLEGVMVGLLLVLLHAL
jgi:hypothetical protein